MREIDWEQLRRELLHPASERDTAFDEDTVQQTLLALVEALAAGIIVLDPLFWCRKTARNWKIDCTRYSQTEAAGKKTLMDLNIPLDTRSETELARERKRRERRRRRA